jgi:UDP-N-acetylmuramyl pentapeptide phosphotransferase/UDP-N-acetylglucosamine-1-phosphate transferase
MIGPVFLSLSAGVGLVAGYWAAVVMLERAARGGVPVDRPDARRMHVAPTPRGGGIGIPIAGTLAAALGALSAPGDGGTVWIVGLVWALPNGVLGWIDDHRPLRSRTKFAVQCLAATLACGLGLRLHVLDLPSMGAVDLGVAGWPFTVLWLVWMANVFNFMDGIDALAAGSGLIFFAGFAVLAGADAGLAGFSLALAAACVGFLRYNWPPARIFMGDGGALYAGAALGGLAVAVSQRGPGPVAFVAALLLLGSFLWDATYTIAWRLVLGEPMRPHRTHLYQRLVLAGWPPARVRWMFLTLALAGAAAGIAFGNLPAIARAGLVILAICTGIGLVFMTRATERRGGGPSSAGGPG